MLIELPVVWIIILNIASWLIFQLSLAWGFTRMATTWFNPGPAASWEKNGRFYERSFAIKRWKDQLPDAALWFTDGFAKGTLSNREPEYLSRFIRETRRGELCHWWVIGCAPVFLIWNPWWGELIIIAYAVAANLPCILIQRYNRIRFVRMLTTQMRHVGSKKQEVGLHPILVNHEIS